MSTPTRRQTARRGELMPLSSDGELYMDGDMSSEVPKLPDFETAETDDQFDYQTVTASQ